MKFERFDIKGEVPGRELAPHEVFLSFYDDSGAEAFEKWWAGEGIEKFSEFYTNFIVKTGVKPENLELFFKVR